MASGDIWILGIHMTKFGKYPDKDIVDLAAEAAMAALTDGGVTMKDIGVLAAGNLMMASAGLGQQLQKQIGQTGIPVYNVANACATGATALRTAIMAIKAGECDMGLAVGAEKLSGAGLLTGNSKAAEAPRRGPRRAGTGPSPAWTAGSAPRPCPESSPRSGWSTDTATAAPVSSCSPASRRRTTPTPTSTPWRHTTKRMTLEEIMNDVMISYPNTRSMCSANCDGAAAAVVVSDARLRTLGPDQRRRAVKVAASVLTTDPWQEACQVLPDINTLTRNAAAQAYEQAGVSPRTSTSSNCTTASQPPSSSTTTTSCSARKEARPTSSSPAPPGATGQCR